MPTINDIHQALSAQALDAKNGIKPLFAQNPARLSQWSFQLESLYFDFSKTHVTTKLIDSYCQYAEQIDFTAQRHALFSGEKINNTEDRAVLHTLLRGHQNQGVDGDLLSQAEKARQQFKSKYQEINARLAQRQQPLKDIIHIGIGGSSLGTRLVFEALSAINSPINIHFIGNIDAHQLVHVLSQCQPANTLVIAVSKTFTTAETLKNLSAVQAWFAQNDFPNAIEQFYAVTANPDNAAKNGINADNVVQFPSWVGGRYSVWSSVSLSAAIVLGFDKFEEFLAGAAKLDQHFYHTPPAQNVCFIASALDHFYVNYCAAASKAIFAYDYRLRALVDYLQQLETESNGKDKQRDGVAVEQKTAPVVWGGVGTDVQHSVFQMMHQGTALIPAEFLLIKQPDHHHDDHHRELLANGLAQTAALLAGQDLASTKELHQGQGLSEAVLRSKVFTGNRPSTTLVIEQLTPHALGLLLAFYEHRVFCSGLFSNINSFDQMGVELGKRLANKVKPLLTNKAHSDPQTPTHSSDLDPSTLALIDLLNRQ